MLSHLRYLIILLLAIPCGIMATDYHWKKSGKQFALYNSQHIVGKMNVSVPQAIKVTQRISRLDASTFKLTYTLTAVADIDSARVEIEFVRADSASYWMIPAISYNGNHWGRGNEPKGTADDQGNWRSYSCLRTPIPGMIYSEDERNAIATWTEAPQNPAERFSCSAKASASMFSHALIWPEEEMPTVYTDRDKYGPGYRNRMTMKKGDRRVITIYLSATPTLPFHQAIATSLNTCWQHAHTPDFNTPDPQEIWQRSVEFVKNNLWAEESCYKGFSIGLLWDGTEWRQRSAWKYESGWCGQNISLANSLLYDYLLNRDEESLDKGIATLDCWSGNCTLDNGLFITHFDHVLSGNRDAILDACNLGTSALNFFQSYHLAKACGLDRPAYLKTAFGICDFAMSDQLDNGCYARGWTMDGKPYVREGTVGCFLVPAMLEAYQQSNNADYLRSAKLAYHYYSQELMNDGYTTAGALDTWCIDKESSITLLRSSLKLYQITKDKAYLDDAVHISNYLSTWMWHYDGIYPQDDAFSRYNYHTFGATSVSVQHHHLDPYALYWVPEWLELSALTGDAQWRDKAMAIWGNGNQLLSDGALIVNGRLRPRGSQNEAYFESNWCFSTPDSRINDWLVAWPCAFRLEALRKTALLTPAK